MPENIETKVSSIGTKSQNFGFTRFPTAEKKIGDITPDDVRVSFIGTLVDKSEGRIVVDDGSGNIEIIAEEGLLNNLKTGKLVRVVGKVISENGVKINGEAVQEFSKFNLELYKKIRSMK